MQISIIYSSENGHNQRMAEAVLRGCESQQGVRTHLFKISDDDFSGSRWSNDEVMAVLDKSDAIIMGSPTFMGSVSSKLKAFMEASVTRYLPETWKDKIAAGFTVSGATAGDKFNTLSTMTTFAMQHGMIWVGLGSNPFNNDEGVNATGHYYGATGRAELDEDPAVAPAASELKAGEILGARVASFVQRLGTS